MQTSVISSFVFIATAVPLLYFMLRLLVPSSGMRCGASLSRVAAISSALVLGSFLFLNPHQDAYSGLDSAAYASMSTAFANGRSPLPSPSPTRDIPRNVSSAFLYRPLSGLRPTTDCAFQTSRDFTTTWPFYMPAYSLARTGSHLGNLFMPFLGTIWLLTLFLAATEKRGSSGILPALAVTTATAYPAWFFRGDFAECAAAIMATSVLLSSSARKFSTPAGFFTTAFSLALTLSFHLTAIIIAIPIAITIAIDAKNIRARIAFAIGAIAGFMPLWLTTRYITAPYGDWTRLSSITKIIRAAPEHAALFAAVALLAVIAVAFFISLGSERLRNAAVAIVRRIPGCAWIMAAILPVALSLVLKTPFQQSFEAGLVSTWHSFRSPAIMLWLLGAIAITRFDKNRTARLSFLLLSWATLLPILIKGIETPAGIWSFRRLLPVTLAFAALFAIPISDFFESRTTRTAKIATTAVLVVIAFANPIRFPVSYTGVNGKGISAHVANLSAFFEEKSQPLAVFDYFQHSIPFGANPRHKVFGLGKHAWNDWGNIAKWLSGNATKEDVLIVSSFTMPAMEEGFVLGDCRPFECNVTKINSKDFLPATRQSTPIRDTVAKAVPLDTVNGPLKQQVVFDGSPIGLRGDWLFTGKGGAWSRKSSGIIGPLPSPGTNVEITVDASWFPPDNTWTNQTVEIKSKDCANAAFLTIGNGRHQLTATISTDKPLPRTGKYDISTPTPYDPAKHGLKGYPADLGIVFYSMEIKQVPAR